MDTRNKSEYDIIMDITPAIPKGNQSITGYGDGKFRIGGEEYANSVLVFPDRVSPWTIKPGAPITRESVVVVLEAQGAADLLLIGAGRKHVILPPIVAGGRRDVGISMEVMDTGAAGRSYRELMAEGPRVAPALIA